jgi:hypothetical protein
MTHRCRHCDAFVSGAASVCAQCGGAWPVEVPSWRKHQIWIAVVIAVALRITRSSRLNRKGTASWYSD